MSVQARMSSSDNRLYNPSRDVAHNFKAVMELVVDRLDHDRWPALTELLNREGVTTEELDTACNCYCNFLLAGAEDGRLSMTEVLDNSGFLQCKPAAQVAIMSMLGTCYTGIQFVGMREATLGGEGPLLTVKELQQQASCLRRYLAMSPFVRQLTYYRRAVVGYFQRLLK
jgi:hypothetical protein